MGNIHSEHHHHSHTITSLNGIYILAIVLNTLYVAIEAGIGFLSNSLGLLSDAGHNLSDVFALMLAMIAFRLSGSHSTKKFTYGFRKSSVLISLLNAIILLVATGAIVIESIHKFTDPAPVNGAAVSWTAGIGIIVNGFTAWLLMKQQKHDLNVRGAFLHMAMDTLVSVGVVISGIIILFTGFVLIDTLVSLAIVVIIFISTWRLLKESLCLSLDGVPENVPIEQIEQHLAGIPGIESWHHLHIWAVSTTENAATLHIVIRDLHQMEELKQKVKEILRENGVRHSTVECELSGTACTDFHCN